jgi:hypothetical protein
VAVAERRRAAFCKCAYHCPSRGLHAGARIAPLQVPTCAPAPSALCQNRATSSASLRPRPFGINVVADVGGECRKCASSPGRARQPARYHVDGDHHGRSGLPRCTPVDQRFPFNISRRQH